MAVTIMTDSASDITQEDAKALGIRVIPLRYSLGEEDFLDGVTISNQEFYERLERDKILPKTSQITPFMYAEEFRPYVEEGDDVVYISISSGVSGCYQSACMAAEEFDGHVFVFDSQEFCISLRVMVEYAARLRDEGKSAKEIFDAMPEALERVRIIALFDTLEYAQKGGRVSKAVEVVGGALKLKLLISIKDGGVDFIKPLRGTKKGFAAMEKYVKENGGIDLSMPHCAGYTGTSNAKIMKFLDKYGYLIDYGEDTVVTHVGTTVGTYAGPGAIAIGYFAEK